jgi:hypothetical protein
MIFEHLAAGKSAGRDADPAAPQITQVYPTNVKKAATRPRKLERFLPECALHDPAAPLLCERPVPRGARRAGRKKEPKRPTELRPTHGTPLA